MYRCNSWQPTGQQPATVLGATGGIIVCQASSRVKSKNNGIRDYGRV
jgi:hypothetical protein